MNNNDLYHYGVLGMKWGVRRYQQKGQTFQYKSRATKKREKKATRAENKYGANDARAKNLRKRAVASQKFDDLQLKYAKETDSGKAFAANLFMGTGPYRTYTMAKASGDTTLSAIAKSFLDVNLGFTGLSAQQYFTRENWIDNHV